MPAAKRQPKASAPEEFGAILRELRTEAGLSMEKLARASGVSTTYISYLESGKRSRGSFATMRPSPGILHQLAKALGVEADYLRKSAGMAEPDGGRPSFEEFLSDEPTLTRQQRDAIRTLYRTFAGRG